MRDGVKFHVSHFSEDATAGEVAPLLGGRRAVRAEFIANDVTISVEPTDQTWSNREM
jgi:hypothetical protein